MMSDKINRQKIVSKLRQLLDVEFSRTLESNHDILMLNLSTTDGFNLHTSSTEAIEIEPSKMAAMASTIFSLSQAATEVFNEANLDISTIETAQGNLLFLRTRLLTLKCVLSMATNTNTSLAEARFLTKRLAKTLGTVKQK